MISVIVPVYKVEKYLSQCVESIQNQTYRDLEIILVDDGSPDRCPQICDEYAKNDARVKVIHQENKGLSGARNAGLNMATGEYIAFVDSDDFILPQMFETLQKKMMTEKAALGICSYVKVDAAGNTKDNVSPIKDEVLTGYETLKKLPLEKGWYYITVWNKLYKKELFDNLRFAERRMHEDEWIIHKILLASENVVTISEKMYCYRNTENSLMTSKASVRRLDGVEAVYERFCDYQKQGYNELLWGAYLSARKAFEIMDSIEFVTKSDVEKKKEIKKKYRYIFKYADGKKGIKDYMVAWFPECYFRIRKAIMR